MVGIIGRNGAGKSTLLKILSRITEPTSGRVRLRGRVSSLLEVGTGFHPELTGRENIYLNGAILGMTRAEIKRKFDEIVAFAEVERFLDTPVKRYSSGMYVRLAFAVAAHLEPEILVVDEVLAVGDAEFQKKCLDKMGDVGHAGRTVLFVSHNMQAITRLCSRCILLENGRVRMDGPSQRVASAYLSCETGTTAVREWPDLSKAPGDDVVRLCAVRVRNEAGELIDNIDIRCPLGIELEYEVLEAGYIFHPHFGLRNEDGVLLFIAQDVDPDWRRRKRPPGRYVSTGWIPGNLLAEGAFSVRSYFNDAGTGDHTCHRLRCGPLQGRGLPVGQRHGAGRLPAANSGCNETALALDHAVSTQRSNPVSRMKVVILAGGFGTRISEESGIKPKPMIEIGHKPILWHIMKIYGAYGVTDFVICCGYRGYLIKEYFASYFLHRSDVTFDLRENRMHVHQNHVEPWRVTLVDTGDNVMTGGRLKRVKDHLDEETFCLTYGDGVSDVNVREVIEFHRKQATLATLTAVQPPGRFGAFTLDKGERTISSFREKPSGDGAWVNGGFFVLEAKVLDYIAGDETIWERDPLEELALHGQLAAYRHSGFWQPMDTLRDKMYLEELWAKGQAPWKVW